MEVQRCPARVTLVGGEVVRCTVTWVETDESMWHKAKVHSGKAGTVERGEVEVMWHDQPTPTTDSDPTS